MTTPPAFRFLPLRDLWWLLNAPGLATPGALPRPPSDWLATAISTCTTWFADLDDQPAPLQHALADAHLKHGRFFRLGREAERLLTFWHRYRPGADLLAAEIPIIDGQRTVGEIDLVFRDPARGLVHWETAIKYFLRHEDGGANACIGPHPGDSLASKIALLRDHQLPLADTALARAALGIGNTPITNEALLAGWCFHPADSDWRQPSNLPPELHPEHPRGWWLRHGRDDVPCSARSSRFVLLERPDWIAPVHRPDAADFHPQALNEVAAALAHHFRRRHEARLVAEVRRDGDGWWQEVARGFVVHPRWPEVVRR